MPAKLENKLTVNVGTSDTPINVQVPVGKVHIATSCLVCNISASPVTVELWTLDIDGTTKCRFGKGGEIAAGDTIEVMQGKLVTMAGQRLYAKASAAASLDITLSFASKDQA